MNNVARMPVNQRAELFAETADRKGLSDAIVEKDFWVCWVLKQLFSIEALSGRLLFKGGTSLSKIFHAINRFSEDIDLAVDYAALGFTGERDPRQEKLSKTRRAAILADMMVACQRYIGDEFLDAFRDRCEEILGRSDAWSLDVNPRDPNVVRFRYPATTSQNLAYVSPQVILELGTHAEFVPHDRFRIRSFAGEEFPNVVADGDIAVTALLAKRTFWEKATNSPSQKLVIFTEHRDTLTYLESKITTLLGRKEAVVLIHGGMGREERMKSQESFRHDSEVNVLIATDAAGEGINLQRAHLMVNYDLPWNPNRLEQRFGRIHRIGQTEVCHLWNLVADETREGDVYRTLLEKLELARKALGGQVFDVLGKLQFQGRALRDLLIEAIRYGDRPDIRAKLTEAIANAVDRPHLQELLEERALAHDVMNASRVARVREDMERAEARRLQPHYIESFFLEAFTQLGGTARQREARRYEVTHVPAPVRNRDRLIGTGEPVLGRYERIAFEKSLVAPQGQPLAAFVCPGHPLLDATLDLTLDRHRDLLRRGAVLVDEKDHGTTPRVLFYLEHAIQDATLLKNGDRRTISKQMLYVEMEASGDACHIHYAPYLDFRPLRSDEPTVEEILDRPESHWISRDLERKALAHAIGKVVPEHLQEVRDRRTGWIEKARAAVKDRLTKEIGYWDHRAQDLKLQEQAGKPNARLNSQEAMRRADELQARLQKRMADLDLESQVSALPPVALGGFVVVPIGLIAQMTGKPLSTASQGVDTQAASARAREIILEIERGLGFEATDREFEKLGYDIESRDVKTGRMRFLEVKGRAAGAATITVTKNEILYSLNKPDDFILAIVEFLDGDSHRVHYVHKPFQREPDFGVTSVNYDFAKLIERSGAPQ